MKNIPIIIDGPDYINRVIELEIDPVHIARQLSLEALREVLNEELKEFDSVSATCESVEFICTKKRFGPQSKKFTDELQLLLFNRLHAETGVYVDVIDIPGSSEKGIDMTISGKIEDYANDVDAIVLVSADIDFIPTIKKLRHKVKIFLVSLQEDFPIELQNEGYATLSLQEYYQGLFKYHYQRFYIKDLNEEKCAKLFSEADDRIFNQVRVTYDGYVYISKVTGNKELFETKFRWETYTAFNGHVGPKAASDSNYIKDKLKEIKIAWERGVQGYIDCSIEAIEAMWPEKKEK